MALENVITSLVLDVIDHDQTQGVVKAIALDSKTRYVQATVVQHGIDYDVDPNAVVTLTILRPDNVGVQITGAVVDVDNADRTGTIKGVYAELTQAALAKSGTLKAQFKMTVGEQILRTEIFQVKNGIALDGETSEWADQYEGYNLDELVQSVNSAVATVSEMNTATSDDVGKALKVKTVTNGKVTEWEFGEVGGGGSVETLSDVQISNLSNGQALTYDSTAQKWKNVTLGGGGSPFDLPTATNLITILRNCVFTKDVSIAIDNLAEALGVNSGGDDDDSMTFQYGQSIPKGNTSRTLELTGMSISLTEIRLVVALHSDFAQGGFCWVQVPNRGTPYVGVDGNGDFYYSNESAYPGSLSATPSNLSDFVDTIKEVRIIWLNPSGWDSQKYMSGFKFFFNGYNPCCGYTLYRCSGFNGSTEVFRLESNGTNGELYDVLTGTTYTFNNTTGMEIVEVSE